MINKSVFYASALTLMIGLTACSGSAETAADSAPSASGPAEATETPGASVGSAAEALARIADCSQVEAAVAPYIEGLVADEGNTVDEWGVVCQWETSENETDLANVRSVSVTMTPLDESLELPDPQLVVEALDGEVLENEWVAANEGIAYTATIGTGVIGAVVTTVSLPGVEVSISGGAWADRQPLDGPASVAVVQQLLG